MLAVLLVIGARTASAATAVEFNRDIRPILSDHCFQCHGPDDKARKAKLRLDTREGMLSAAHGSAAVAPGAPDRSELIARITAADPEDRMPPPEAKKELTPQQIERLRQWIEEGASWQDHWAFVTPRLPEMPQVRDTAWPITSIDRFILARLEQAGLAPSPEADRRTLLRRLSFDLTGLPPSPADVDAFVHDPAPNAYEKVVDRLLASERFGERMALAWMDAARYGDSSVYHANGVRDMWPWRDWVIRAYNANMPFDQFTLDQLAGDLLPGASISQKVASGFNRNHGTTDEGGANEAFNKDFGPEKHLDLAKTYDKREWTEKAYKDGEPVALANPDHSALYLHRTLSVSRKESYELSLGSDDSIKVWLNGKELLAKNVGRAVAPDQEKVRLDLDPGESTLLLKIGNGGGPSGFYFKILGSGIPPEITELYPIADADFTAEQRKRVTDYFQKNWWPEGLARAQLIADLKQQDKALHDSVPTCMVMEDMEDPRKTYVLSRGNYASPLKEEEIRPDVPAALGGLPENAPRNRLGLARWLIDPNHPLTARVAVNRY